MRNKLELKQGMIGKAVDVIKSCKTYRQFLVADRYVKLMYHNYNMDYSQLQFLSNVYMDEYNKVLWGNPYRMDGWFATT